MKTISELLKRFFCKHQPETNGIDKGTMCEVNTWCHKCGKPLHQ